MTIRRATTEDAALLAQLSETVQRLHVSAQPDIFKPLSDLEELTVFYRETLEKQDNHVFIAQSAGEAVGCVVAKIVRRPENPFTYALDSVVIENFCVVETQQGRGHGSRLLDAIYELMREQNIQRVAVDVWDFNGQAREFYEKRGFVPFMHRLEKDLD